jgi:hypothetical protein
MFSIDPANVGIAGSDCIGLLMRKGYAAAVHEDAQRFMHRFNQRTVLAWSRNLIGKL